MTAAVTTANETQPPIPPAVKKKSMFEEFFDYVTTTQFLSQIAPLVGGEAQAKMFVRVVLNACHKTPALLTADRKSLILSCMQAARDRLMPDGKEAVLNIYFTKEKRNGGEVWIDKVQYLAMGAGMVKKLYQSGHVTYVDAAAVYAKDVFEFERGDAPRLLHKPTGEKDPGEIIASYLVVRLKEGGEWKREVMFRRDIDRVRAASKAPDSPAWRDWPDQMAIKSVIKRGYKQLPSSVELDQMIEQDNDAMGFSDFTIEDPTPTTGSNVDAINAAVTAGKEDPGKPKAPAIESKPGEKVPPVTVEGEKVVVDESQARGGEVPEGKPGSERKPSAAAGPITLPTAKVREHLDAALKAKSRDKLDEAAAEISLVVNLDDQKKLVETYKQHVAALEADDGK